MKKDNFYNLITPSLIDINIFLLISCENHYSASLLEIWYELIDEFSFLTDFYSDYVLPDYQINYALEQMTNIKEPASVMPQYIDNIKRWILLCTEYFFKTNKKNQKAIILHEIGHIIVAERKILDELRSKWGDVETIFDVFCSKINRDIDYYKENEGSLRELFGYYIFDILKIPGEFYANLWVRDNCYDYFLTLVEGQFNNYVNADEKMRENIKNHLLKYFLIHEIIKCKMLTVLIKNNDDDELFNDIIKHIDKGLCDLKKLLDESQYDEILNITEIIKKIYYNPKDINSKFFNIFMRYINMLKLQYQDFLPYPE